MKGFFADVFDRSADDGIFFLASGLTFSILLAAIPFLLLVLSLPTLLLGEIERFQEEALTWLWRILPVAAPEVQAELRERIRSIVDSAGQIGLVSALLFAWFSTRLFGALRTALSQVFDIEDPRNVITGKITDFRLVLVSTALLSVNVILTAFLGTQGRRVLEQAGVELGRVQSLIALVVVPAAIYVMFLLIYKYVPARRLAWRTAAIAALVAALGFELLKLGFGWYVTNWADYSNIFFAFATLVILIVGIYYAAVLFLMGGEVAQVFEQRRLARRQREILD